jgi:hypothetical protein
MGFVFVPLFRSAEKWAPYRLFEMERGLYSIQGVASRCFQW